MRRLRTAAPQNTIPRNMLICILVDTAIVVALVCLALGAVHMYARLIGA